MIQVKKRSFAQKKLLLLACLVGALVIAVAAYFIVNAVLKNMSDEKNNGKKYDLLIGESYYYGIPLAYAPIESNQINMINVKQGDDEFTVLRMEQFGNNFVFSYNGSAYIPPIAYEDSYFDYSSLYASDAMISGSAEMPKLTYVCSAVGNLQYDERIKLSSDPIERARQLAVYFDEDNTREIIFTYVTYDVEQYYEYDVEAGEFKQKKDEDGKPLAMTKTVQEKVTVKIGKKVVTDSAYYYQVKSTEVEKLNNIAKAAIEEKGKEYKAEEHDRSNYVYAAYTPYLEYALLSMDAFIEAKLTAAGIDNDGAYAPMLTPDYKQWKNTVYKYVANPDGTYSYTSSDGKSNPDPWKITDGAQIYGAASIIQPIDYTAGYYSEEDLVWVTDPSDSDNKIPSKLTDQALGGYHTIASSLQIFELPVLKDNENYKYALNALINKEIGKYDGVGTNPSSFRFTVIDESLPISFYNEQTEQDDDSVTYTYTITGIEAVFGASAEISSAGASAAGAEKLKITYTYKINGKENKLEGDTAAHVCHAVIDLSNDLIPAGVKSELSGRTVGAFAQGAEIEFDITYTKDNAEQKTTKLVIKDIFRVYNKTGTQIIKTITEDSIVSFRFYYERDGKAITSVESYTLELSKINDESSQLYKDFKAALVGETLGLGKDEVENEEDKIVVSTSDSYYQAFSSFVEYEINEIEFFTTSELIVSFAFINSNNRDPFYRESVFENTMGDDSEFGLYAINYNTCQNVVSILGGTTEEESGAEGYIGLETVSTDLSPESMKKYGLYSNKIYFELPRGIYSPDYGDEDSVLYDFYETLGFIIYISDEQIVDGELCRYAASTLYNTIVKVDPDDFRFLDSSFVELWARRELFFVDVKNIQEMDISFNMTDLIGDYKVAFLHDKFYIDANGDKVYELPEEGSYQEKSLLTLGITPNGDLSGFTSSLFKDSYSSYTTTGVFGGGKEWVRLDDIYGGWTDKYQESHATSNMREFIMMLYYLSYSGSLTEEEQKAARYDEHNNEKTPLMTLKFKIEGSSYRYGYDFYRLDDRRVMVSIYRMYADGTKWEETETSYFYISTPAFKKVAGEFVMMLNGKTVNNDDYYIENGN